MDISAKELWHNFVCFWKSGKVMEAYDSYIFLSI